VTFARDQKQISDVDSLNRSVLAALKRSMSHASRAPTLSGSKIDERLTLTMQSPGEALGNGWRAYWDANAYRFITGKTGDAPEIKRFVPGDRVTSDGKEDANAKSSMVNAARDNCIWDYQEAPPTIPAGPSMIPLSEVSESAAIPFPTGPGGGGPHSLTPLAAPTFSIGSGAFPIASFNAPLTIGNPNPARTSTLYYLIDFGNWKAYSGPLSVPPGSVVAAQAIATSDLYSDRSRVDQNYDFIPGSLIPPHNLARPSRTGSFYR